MVLLGLFLYLSRYVIMWKKWTYKSTQATHCVVQFAVFLRHNQAIR